MVRDRCRSVRRSRVGLSIACRWAQMCSCVGGNDFKFDCCLRTCPRPSSKPLHDVVKCKWFRFKFCKLQFAQFDKLSTLLLPRVSSMCSTYAGKGLTQLDVSQNQLQNAPTNAIKNLHHLLILNLNHNRISQIHNRAFEGLDTLEILTLYENKINVVEPDAFRGLEKYVPMMTMASEEETKSTFTFFCFYFYAFVR